MDAIFIKKNSTKCGNLKEHGTLTQRNTPKTTGANISRYTAKINEAK